MSIFKGKKEPKRICNAWGKELLNEGMRFYLGDYEWIEAYDEIVNWLADNNGMGLLCAGDFGTGKTIICENIITAMFDEWKWDYITLSAYEMSRKIEEIKKHDIVIIDDVGVEGEAVIYGEHRNIFNEIVDFAEKNRVLLILTTNLDVKEMKAKYGIRTVDRLNHITKDVIFHGKTFRKPTEVKQKYYVFGQSFDTEEEADKFEAEQLSIRSRIQKREIRLYDDYAEDAYELNEALEEKNGTVYKYGMAKE